MSDTLQTIREFVLEQFLPGTAPAELDEKTPLRTTGILDSIATLKLLSFLEEHFEIETEPYDIERFGTLAEIVELVHEKQAARS